MSHGTRRVFTKVKHLLDPNSGKFLMYQEFVNLFKVKPCFTVYYGLFSAIKNKWKIFPTGRQKQTQNRKTFQCCSTQNNCWEQISTTYQWKSIISYRVEPPEIQKLYKRPFSVTENTKLIMFQFKINHNIIYTKD